METRTVLQYSQFRMRQFAASPNRTIWSFRLRDTSPHFDHHLPVLLGQHCRLGIAIHKGQCAPGASSAISFSKTLVLVLLDARDLLRM